MKKFFLMLLAVVGISVAAMADGGKTCSVYGSNGATAVLKETIDCADDSGKVFILLKIENKQDKSLTKVVVDVYEDKTNRFVTSKQIYVEGSHGGESVKGLEPGKCYTFSINSASCN